MKPCNKLISLTICNDYPCQYKSFFYYIDSIAISLNSFECSCEKGDSFTRYSSGEKMFDLKFIGETNIEAIKNGDEYKITIQSNKLQNNFSAQIIPVGSKCIYPENSEEILVNKQKQEHVLIAKNQKFIGFIILIKLFLQDRVYDSVEVFTPANATWGVGNDGYSIGDKKTGEEWFGRQKFPNTYYYDGSLFMINKKELMIGDYKDVDSVILKKSCIINDMVDYYYFLSNNS